MSERAQHLKLHLIWIERVFAEQTRSVLCEKSAECVHHERTPLLRLKLAVGETNQPIPAPQNFILPKKVIVELRIRDDSIRVVGLAVDFQRELRVLAEKREINPTRTPGAVKERRLRHNLGELRAEKWKQEFRDEQPLRFLRDARRVKREVFVESHFVEASHIRARTDAE